MLLDLFHLASLVDLVLPRHLLFDNIFDHHIGALQVATETQRDSLLDDVLQVRGRENGQGDFEGGFRGFEGENWAAVVELVVGEHGCQEGLDSVLELGNCEVFDDLVLEYILLGLLLFLPGIGS